MLFISKLVFLLFISPYFLCAFIFIVMPYLLFNGCICIVENQINELILISNLLETGLSNWVYDPSEYCLSLKGWVAVSDVGEAYEFWRSWESPGLDSRMFVRFLIKLPSPTAGSCAHTSSMKFPSTTLSFHHFSTNLICLMSFV